MRVVEMPVKSLSDIPGMLRGLADRIEAGGYGEVDSLLCVMPRDGDYPRTFAWGVVDGFNEPTIQFQLALQWHCKHSVGRE